MGAFCLVAAVLLRFYAYDKVAVAPVDQNSVSTLVGPNATVFDTGELEEIQTELTTTAKTVGDIDATEKAPDNVVVWITTSSTKSADGVIRSRSVEKIAFDKVTGEAVNCCGEYIESDEGARENVRRKGLLVKFPFRTEKKTYQWWDDSVGDAVPIKYVKTEKVEGLETYMFQHTIEPVVTSTIDLPAEMLGEVGDETLTAEMTYSNVRTLWVEPATGVVIKRSEKQHNTIRYNGEDKIVTTDVDTGFDAKTIKENADTYGSLATMLGLVRTWIPLLFLLLGLGLIAFGVVRVRQESVEA
ncbi:DUF3068 domain-containing protein [Nocardioides sp. AE5]|uniref:DUF3068 domain-containing protein n=1 Tax=Nocardioides sp. AE5 TaxID=2962573 RepID=UPI00288206B3|nr:DUF3068 domain-containing protein [Nocardioides sp. AE5]MDT0201317.1 DUF3068 domain-containing protein [Nocardioides sp. AE5]